MLLKKAESGDVPEINKIVLPDELLSGNFDGQIYQKAAVHLFGKEKILKHKKCVSQNNH